MIQYLVGEDKYHFSYQELREQYILHTEMSDEEFLKNLPSALHLAIYICFIKETPSYICLSDKGIVHEIAHLIQFGDGEVIDLKEIRKLFKKALKLH